MREAGRLAAMDCLFGLVGKDFVLIGADTSAVQSIVLQKTDEDKIMVLDSHKLLGTSGATGDRSACPSSLQCCLNG